MSENPSIAVLAAEATKWRRDFHSHPELLYEVHRTVSVVAEKLKEFGVDEIVLGIGKTGVVGVIKGRQDRSGKVIGLRADMDALPIAEETNLPYRSKTPGSMHACGHDGHMAMLLGATKYLAETRDFDGTVVAIFQPAEEGGAGGRAMVEDGLMDRFNISEVYGLHNLPSLPIGQFSTRVGPLLAAFDRFDITIEGRGGHAAMPHRAVDVVLAGGHVVAALQSIASRNVSPLNSVVVSVTTFHAGDTFNVLPQRAELSGTVRTLSAADRDLCEQRLRAIVDSVAGAFGATAVVKYERCYPITITHAAQTEVAVKAARAVASEGGVNDAIPPTMGSEDFGFMLEARPGAFLYIGNGDSSPLHHPSYDFNDSSIEFGISYWAKLVEQTLPLAPRQS